MATAAPRPRARRLPLRESAPLAGGAPARPRVDEEACVIRGVKVLGVNSSNRRVYLPEAIRAAAHLYEGVSVRLDHPADPDDQRSVEEPFGWLRNVRVGPDGGLFADLHYLASHPFAARLVEAAKRNPSLYSLSHNADGATTEGADGVVTVHEITEVRSVDLVTDGATTRSLFESHRPRRGRRGETMPQKTTLKEWFAKTPLLPSARRAVLEAFRRAKSSALLEGVYMEADDLPPADMPPGEGTEPASAEPVAAVDPAGMNPEDALRSGFNGALHAIIDDTTLRARDKAARLKELLMAFERLTAAGEEIPEADGDAPADDEAPLEESHGDEDDPLEECDQAPVKEGEEEDEEMALKESRDLRRLRAENARLKAEIEVRALCESERVAATPRLVKALAAFATADERKEFLAETRAAAAGQQPRPAGKPRTAALTEGAKPAAAVGDLDDFVRSITRN